MIHIRGPDDVRRIDDPSIHGLVQERLAQLGDCDPGEVALVVVQQGDTLDGLEEETGLAIATNPFDGTRFPTPASSRSGNGPKNTKAAGSACSLRLTRPARRSLCPSRPTQTRN
jgi:transposase